MAMQNNGLLQELARIHSNNVLPGQDFGWLGNLNMSVDVPIGTIFRPRLTIRRFNRTAPLNTTVRLQFERNLSGNWFFITDVSDLVKLAPTIRFEDEDDSLDLLLTTTGTLVDGINGGYQSEGDGITGFYSFPSGTSAVRWEPEWSCVCHGSVLVDDSFKFRAVMGNGNLFAVGYSNNGRITAKAPVVDGVVKFKSEITQAIQMVSKIQPAVRMKSDIAASVRMKSNIKSAVRMKTEITRAVNMKTEVC